MVYDDRSNQVRVTADFTVSPEVSEGGLGTKAPARPAHELSAVCLSERLWQIEIGSAA